MTAPRYATDRYLVTDLEGATVGIVRAEDYGEAWSLARSTYQLPDDPGAYRMSPTAELLPDQLPDLVAEILVGLPGPCGPSPDLCTECREETRS